MIDHVSVGVSDLARSASFYAAILDPLGMARLRAEPHRVGFGTSYAEFWINIVTTSETAAAAAHVAFRARSDEAVCAFHAAALAAGGVDDGPPGLRERGHGPRLYYAAFVRDPDGNRIEAVTFLLPA